MNTIAYNDIYERFVRFGKVANKKERKKIAEIVSSWEIIPIQTANIDSKYVDTINMFISDNEIKEVIKLNSEFKTELAKKLFDLLENIDTENKANRETTNKIQFLHKFQNLTSDDFENIWKGRNEFKEHITQTYLKKEIPLDFYQKQFNNTTGKKTKLLKSIKQKEKKLINIELLFSEYFKEETSKIRDLEKEKDELLKIKVVGKIDLKTLKPVKSNNDEYISASEEIDKKAETIKETILNRHEKIEEQKNEIEKLKNEITNIPQEISAIHSKLSDNWKTELELKLIQEEIERIDNIRINFLTKLYKEIEKLKKMLELLSPFMLDFSNTGRLWDMSKGNWHSINFRLIQKYSEILEQQKELQELANLLGKYRRAETELEEEEFENIEIINKFRVNHSGKSELIGITESNDLNHLLPTELALFSDLATESIFFKRYAEKKLQSYEFISKQKDYETRKTIETRQKEKELDKGPFILAIDTSGSMHGQPEHFAKVIAFAITKIALKEKRKAFLISFSTGIEKFELTNINNSLPKLIEFLQMSFYGGTDATEAVKEAINQMQTENYKKADLLIITDGIFSNLNKSTLTTVSTLKEEGNKFNSLIIGQSQNDLALNFCDNNWTYDFRHDSLKKLITDIKKTINP